MSHIKDRLSSYHDWMQDIVNRYKLVTARDFLEMIEQLQKDLEQDEKENGWIPVSERLPECCICCTKQDSCQCKCDVMDSYEYAEKCEEYIEETEEQ